MAARGDGGGPASELTYLIKRVHFFRREVPIIVQNKNGPCPLLAIANVLLLRNQLQLHQDVGEISETRLMSLVAERLLDTNLNVSGKDAAYVSNQQQNISDAIALLPKLATGIDVNVRFRGIVDFEFTPECAIFDLLDISLIHGWLVDPQDTEASDAIGGSSYNNLVEKLVELQCSGVDLDLTRINSLQSRSAKDFLRAAESRKDNRAAHSNEAREKDLAAELASSLSAIALSSLPGASNQSSVEGRPKQLGVGEKQAAGELGAEDNKAAGAAADENERRRSKGGGEEAAALAAAIQLSLGGQTEGVEQTPRTEQLPKTELPISESDEDGFVRVSYPEGLGSKKAPVGTEGAAVVGSEAVGVASVPGSSADHAESQKGVESISEEGALEPKGVKSLGDSGVKIEANQSEAAGGLVPVVSTTPPTVLSESVKTQKGKEVMPGNEQDTDLTTEVKTEVKTEVSGGEASTSAEAGAPEGESEGGASDTEERRRKVREGRAVQGFLESTASQLTYHGLVKLHEGIKERELCVFFRNNHFNTLFRYDGHLYLLATDQGYLHQPGLVWEKLSGVDGDTTFVTGTFQLYRPPDDYQPPSEGVGEHSGADADLQYALALQQEESDLLAVQEAQLAQAAERRRQQEAMQRPPEPQPASGRKPKHSDQSSAQGKKGKPKDSKAKDDKCSVM